jgi:predicted nucleic acid-binding protein
MLRRSWRVEWSGGSGADGVYVALAEALDAPLVTFDGRIAAAPAVRAVVISVIRAEGAE